MKIALVHDYLIDYGGAERVLLALHELFPKAPIYTLIADKKKIGSFWEKIKGADIKTSWFNYLPFVSKLISPARFLIPALWASFNLKDYDLIISSSNWAIAHGFGQGGRVGKPVEICYCHAPPRYLYGYETTRAWRGRWYGEIVDFYALIVNHFMRQYDFSRAQKVDYFIANSKNVALRIKKFYRRDAAVIYPPIDLPPISQSPKIPISNYFLTGGRLVSSKNFDLIIKACKRVSMALKIFGSGPEEGNLRRLAGKNVEFVGKVGDKELAQLYKNAKAFIAAQKDEDFGMTVLEANAWGHPVIAYRGGGYLETVIPGKTGMFFNQLTVDNLVSTLRQFDTNKWDRPAIAKYAQKFSKGRFEKEMLEFIKSYARAS